MDHPLSGLLRVVVCVGLVLLVTGCGEDQRYSASTQVICRAIRPRTDVSACPSSWPKISSDQSRSERPSRSPIRVFSGLLYLGLQKIAGTGILIVPLPEI